MMELTVTVQDEEKLKNGKRCSAKKWWLVKRVGKHVSASRDANVEVAIVFT
jgi:hypothetical protein